MGTGSKFVRVRSFRSLMLVVSRFDTLSIASSEFMNLQAQWLGRPAQDALFPLYSATKTKGQKSFPFCVFAFVIKGPRCRESIESQKKDAQSTSASPTSLADAWLSIHGGFRGGILRCLG